MEPFVFKSLKAFFKSRKEVTLAYVFGSVAKYPDRSPRDLDLAILLKKPLEGMKSFDYKIKLIETLHSFFKKKKIPLQLSIDLVMLNRADPLLTYQVVKYGKLLYERHKKLDRDFKVQTMTRYIDAKPLHDFFYERAMRQ